MNNINLYLERTGMIWISATLPYTIIPTIIPYIFDRLPPLAFILVPIPINWSAVTCLLLAKTRIWLKYLGIGLIGSGSAILAVTGLSLTAYFDKITISSYCAGTGVGMVFGPLYVTGTRHSNVLCVL